MSDTTINRNDYFNNTSYPVIKANGLDSCQINYIKHEPFEKINQSICEPNNDFSNKFSSFKYTNYSNEENEKLENINLDNDSNYAKVATETNKFSKIFFISAFVIAILLICFTAFVLPKLEVKKINLIGNSSISRAEILEWAQLPNKAMWASLDSKGIASAIKSHPGVLDCSVERIFPDSLLINIEERKPVAIIYAKNQSGKMTAHFVDSDGILFSSASKMNKNLSYPIISGIKIDSVVYGMRLPIAFSSALGMLKNIIEKDPVLVEGISELCIIDKENGQSEILLYPTEYKVPVRLRNNLNSEILKGVMLVLDVLKNNRLESETAELDFRTSVPVLEVRGTSL